MTDELRKKQRYTLSHLAHDVKKQTGATEPLRDWFPLSAMGPVQRSHRHADGGAADWGALKCGCHPELRDRDGPLREQAHQEMVPLSAFLDLEQLLVDIQEITDAGASRARSRSPQTALALLKNFDPRQGAARASASTDLVKQFLSQTGNARQARRRVRERRQRVRVAAPLRRRDVVPGPLQLRLPPHRDVHHPVRHADGGDQLLRVQHGRRLAEPGRPEAKPPVTWIDETPNAMLDDAAARALASDTPLHGQLAALAIIADPCPTGRRRSGRGCARAARGRAQDGYGRSRPSRASRKNACLRQRQRVWGARRRQAGGASRRRDSRPVSRHGRRPRRTRRPRGGGRIVRRSRRALLVGNLRGGLARRAARFCDGQRRSARHVRVPANRELHLARHFPAR
jgi:hypothetical protein